LGQAAEPQLRKGDNVILHGSPDENGSRGSGPAQDRLNDLQVYRKLLELSQDTGTLSQQCWSLVGSTALAAASVLLRSLASGVYRQGLGG
jgi:hypothetical protein